MRYLIDTCIFIHYVAERDRLSHDVLSILEDYDNTICVSAETPRELVIQFNNGKLVSRLWKTAKEMVDAIQNVYFIDILPLRQEHITTYAELELNHAQDHRDPSDHVIIAHAITEHLPLISDDSKFEFYRKQGLDFICNKK